MDFIDLKSQQQRLRPQIEAAIRRVLDHGAYIMGPEVNELEEKLAHFTGAKHAISCANGTDALALGLMAKGIKTGDAILVPSFTFAATAEVVAWVGATPVFVDVLENTFNMDPAGLEQGIQKAKSLDLKPRGIIAVDLFGQPAAYDEIEAIAKNHGLWVMEDGAQSFGAYYKQRRVGTLGDISTTSFFPAKPLGCYGDGGAIFTNDDELAAIIKSLRVHGQGADRYDNVRIGMNGRLDTLQAAILLEKLAIYEDEIIQRQQIANAYNEMLRDCVKVPVLIDDVTSVWAQYTVRLPDRVDRAKLVAALKSSDIPVMVYYPKPLHQQSAYAQYPVTSDNGLPVSERLSRTVLSLPMHAYLSETQQEHVVSTLKACLKSS